MKGDSNLKRTGHAVESAKKQRGDATEQSNDPLCRREVADYLVKMLPELVALADRARLDLSSYLLRMALRDAKEMLSRER